MKPAAASAYGNANLCCWPRCFTSVEHPEARLCEVHFRQVGMLWLRDNIELVREVAGVAEQEVMFDRIRRDSEARRPERERLADLARRDREAGAVVYYLRIGDRIKIGFTTNLAQRVAALRLDPDAVLATEPGGRDIEYRRHLQFADERYGRREDFAPSDRLMAHIRTLQMGGSHA